MAIEMVIACRHGEYLDNGLLTSEGIEQSQVLARRIKELVNGQKVTLFTSPAKRAVNTAAILAKELELSANPILCNVLYSEEYYDGEQKRLAMLEHVQEGVIVAVTHYESPSGIVNAFSRAVFGKRVDPAEIFKGEAIVLCLKTGEISLIP